MVKIAVLGAGINGLAVGVRIKEKYSNVDVTIISNEFTPDTTGDGSGGLWYPYLCGSTPEELITKWGGETYKFLHSVWMEDGINIRLLPLYSMKRNGKSSIPIWAHKVVGYQAIDEKQMEYLRKLYSTNFDSGHTFTSFVIHVPSLLKYLTNRFLKANGRFLKHEIKSLNDNFLSEYDIIINCTGLGSRYIVPDDKLYPIRGQIAKVKAPWINEIVMDDDAGNYIIPNVETCVMGGTHQENVYDKTVDPKDTEFIINGCTKLIPSLKDAELVDQWVGLRPGRSSVRLEAEIRDDRLIIHNYGHGGSGFTLFWGCSKDVIELLEKYCRNLTHKQKSKL